MARKRKPPRRIRLPETRRSVTHRGEIRDLQSGAHDIYITAGLYDNFEPGELFIQVGKEGGTLNGLMDGVGVLTSLLLQYGVPREPICAKLRGMKFVPEGDTDNPDIPTTRSILDYVFTWFESMDFKAWYAEQLARMKEKKGGS